MNTHPNSKSNIAAAITNALITDGWEWVGEEDHFSMARHLNLRLKYSYRDVTSYGHGWCSSVTVSFWGMAGEELIRIPTECTPKKLRAFLTRLDALVDSSSSHFVGQEAVRAQAQAKEAFVEEYIEKTLPSYNEDLEEAVASYATGQAEINALVSRIHSEEAPEDPDTGVKACFPYMIERTAFITNYDRFGFDIKPMKNEDMETLDTLLRILNRFQAEAGPMIADLKEVYEGGCAIEDVEYEVRTEGARLYKVQQGGNS